MWVGAQSREGLVSGYSAIAGLLKLPSADGKDQTLATEAVQRWLGSHERWLLILDNADDLAISERALDPEHPRVAMCLENYARLLQAVGRSEDVASLEARARAIRAKRASKTPPTMHEPTPPSAA